MKKLFLPQIGILIAMPMLFACYSVSTSPVREFNPLDKMTAFTAFGNQDGSWRAVINNLTLQLEGQEIEMETITVKHSIASDEVTFTGEQRDISLIIKVKECVDDNGNIQPFTATLYYEKQMFRGCAIQEAIPTAPT